MHNYRVSESTSTATNTTASVTVSGGSQPKSAIERHHQGSFAGLPTTTVHTPESTHIPVAEQPFARLRLLAEASTSQTDPSETFATQRASTFDDEDQEQSASSLSLLDEPSPAADDANPIMEVEEPHGVRFTVLPDINSIPPSDQNLVNQDSDSTDKWIIYSGDKIRPFQCGYEGCDRTYTSKHNLKKHFALHIGDSQFRCYYADCAGAIRYRDSQALARHIHLAHILERPFECNICNKRFGRSDNFKRHQRDKHSIKKEQKSPPKRKREVDPFEALAKHRVITFDDEDHEQSANYLSLPDGRLLSIEPSQATDYANPIMEVEEPHELRITVLPDNISRNNKIITTIGVPKSKIPASIREHFRLAMLRTAPETVQTWIVENPKLPSDQNLAIQDSDSSNKWIVYSGDKTKPFKCDYKGCGKIYSSKQNLQIHLVSHISDSQFRCYYADCAGKIGYCDSQALARHIHRKHKMERPFKCNICNQRFGHWAHLKRHRERLHSTEKWQTTKKE